MRTALVKSTSEALRRHGYRHCTSLEGCFRGTAPLQWLDLHIQGRRNRLNLSLGQGPVGRKGQLMTKGQQHQQHGLDRQRSQAYLNPHTASVQQEPLTSVAHTQQSDHSNWGLINVCFPFISPFLLMSRDSIVSSLCFLYMKNSVLHNLIRKM